MPVYVNSDRSTFENLESVAKTRRQPSLQYRDRSERFISIGLINNMPQAAFTATERQFVSLLDSASEDLHVRLSLYSLFDVPFAAQDGNKPQSAYARLDELWETKLDALIVTGKEPVTTNLRDEPCWESLTQVVEWARGNTYSTVWSCFAAHAAVLYMDGIARRKYNEKHFGVFECVRVCDHLITMGMPASFRLPHSRWNGLAEEDLVAFGYSVLTRISGSGVDTFVKDDKSLFVFLQGHPEYDADTLLREYRRDVCRYLNHETTTHPSIPTGYFDESTEIKLATLRDMAISRPSGEIFAGVSTVLEASKVKNTWCSTTDHIYRNWLNCISMRKSGARLADAIVA